MHAIATEDDLACGRYGGLWKNLHKADQQPAGRKNEPPPEESAELQQLIASSDSQDAVVDI